jgi:PadR family transcriptional regulator PadR
MRRYDSLGEFDHAVLSAVAHLEEDAYGVTIRREIESRTRRTIAVGALHTALDRLERKGYLTSTMSEPIARRGGRNVTFTSHPQAVARCGSRASS